MAGSISDTAVIWVAGESAGKSQSGASATLPTDALLADIVYGAGAPSGAPAANKGPFYMNNANHKLYSWNNGSWVQVSGWNS